MARFEFKPSVRPAAVSDKDWNDWTWQLRQSLKTQSQFEKNFSLTVEERETFLKGDKVFNFRCTPYYASLAIDHPLDPLRKILMPDPLELSSGKQQMLDPLGEKKNNPAPRVIHRYSDRLLFLVTDICSVYCRYCTRKHFTGQDQAFIQKDDYQTALEYIRSKKGLREVIISGGDPLTLSDANLEMVLRDLREIPHIELIRIGTRMPVVSPMRITENLVRILRRYKPVYLMTHFNHPRELTLEAAQAVELFVDHGVPVFNQMVLLNGVNNHPAIVQALSRRLLFLRAKPYYMFQCDPSEGTDHLRTSVEDSLEIQRDLWGHLSGLAMPHLALDIPDGGGKAYLVPDFEVSRSPEARTYKGWDGVESQYINPEHKIAKPFDAHLYLEEWNELKQARSIQKDPQGHRMDHLKDLTLD